MPARRFAPREPCTLFCPCGPQRSLKKNPTLIFLSSESPRPHSRSPPTTHCPPPGGRTRLRHPRHPHPDYSPLSSPATSDPPLAPSSHVPQTVAQAAQGQAVAERALTLIVHC